MSRKYQLWDGLIPCEISILECDLSSDRMPDPYFALLSRLSYLSFAAGEAIDYFKPFAIESVHNIWFEYNGKVLKGHIPVGVLYDLCSPDVELPWKLNLHFSPHPTEKVIRMNSEKDVTRIYTHSLKQAIYLLSGSTTLFTSLSIMKHDQLVHSVINVSYTDAEEVLREITSRVIQPRILPVRLVLVDRPVQQKPVMVYDKAVPVDELPAVSVAEALPNTEGSGDDEGLGGQGQGPEDKQNSENSVDAEAAAPQQGVKGEGSQSPGDELVTDEQLSESRRGSADSAANTGGEELCEDGMLLAGTFLAQALPHLFPTSVDGSLKSGDSWPASLPVRVLVQGVEVPPSAPMYLLWKQFSHPDMFLYMVVISVS